MNSEKITLAEIHKHNPGNVKGIIAYDLSNASQLHRFFEDVNVPFEKGRLHKYSSFRFLLENREQFESQVLEFRDSFNEKNLWHVYRQFAEEIRLELLERSKA